MTMFKFKTVCEELKKLFTIGLILLSLSAIAWWLNMNVLGKGL